MSLRTIIDNLSDRLSKINHWRKSFMKRLRDAYPFTRSISFEEYERSVFKGRPREHVYADFTGEKDGCFFEHATIVYKAVKVPCVGFVNTVTFKGGTLKSGNFRCNVWEDGIFEGGILVCQWWKNGTFRGEEFYGYWKDGTFEKGKRMPSISNRLIVY